MTDDTAAYNGAERLGLRTKPLVIHVIVEGLARLFEAMKDFG